MGLQAKEQIIKDVNMSKNPLYVVQVNRVARKIADVANRSDFDWEFYTIEGETINAFCLSGGKIFVYEGLLKLVKNDDQLATVIGHEVAHALLRHGAERVSMQMVSEGTKALAQVGAAAMGYEWNELYDVAFGVGSQYGVLLPYSRKHELEADEVGLMLMYDACYDPYESIKFWQTMKANGGAKQPEFMSTHPTDDNRIASLQAYITQELAQRVRNCR